ncbi:MAG: anti-sigma factor antagonist [Aeromicrobium sp.]|jgi:anti-sigma B factor antagonist|nr:anti-sigma factor antagonist [Aeromicrobium sp.]
MELAVTSRTDGDFEIVEVGGEIDVYTAPRLREAIVAAIDEGHTRLIIDVQKVDFLDSTGLGVLVGALKRVRADDGSLDIVCTQERILKIFQITGLDKVFGLHRSVDEARSSQS